MSAALATMDVADSSGLVQQLEYVGARFRQGIAAQAASHGVPLRQSGPVQMPLILFDNDPAFEKGFHFTAEALTRGVYLHPKHNMFLCLAHTEGDIDEALQATDAALKAVAQRFGRA